MTVPCVRAHFKESGSLPFGHPMRGPQFLQVCNKPPTLRTFDYLQRRHVRCFVSFLWSLHENRQARSHDDRSKWIVLHFAQIHPHGFQWYGSTVSRSASLASGPSHTRQQRPAPFNAFRLAAVTRRSARNNHIATRGPSSGTASSMRLRVTACQALGGNRPSVTAEKYQGCQPRSVHNICAVPALWRALYSRCHSQPVKLQELI